MFKISGSRSVEIHLVIFRMRLREAVAGHRARVHLRLRVFAAVPVLHCSLEILVLTSHSFSLAKFFVCEK